MLHVTGQLAQCMLHPNPQVLAMALLSVGWLGAALLQKSVDHQPVTSLWGGYADPVAWLVLLWPAVGQYSSGEISAVAAQSRCSCPSCPLCSCRDLCSHACAACSSKLSPMNLPSDTAAAA